MADRHKAHEDMRLSEVAEPPAHEGNELDETERTAVWLGQRCEKFRMLRMDQIRCRRKAPQHQCRPHGNHEDGKEHHHALDKIRTRHGEKTADERVEHHDHGTKEQRRQIRQLENCLKEAPRRHESR